MREGIHRNQSLHTATSTDIAADLSDQQHFHYQTHSIEMKKFLIKSSIAGLSLLAMGTTYAQQGGTVTFTGDINPVTCVVAPSSLNQTVNYGIVPPNGVGFSGSGNTVGETANSAYERTISITLTGCTTPGSNNQPPTARVKFTGSSANKISPAGRLETSNASIHIQIMNPNDPALFFNLTNFSAPVTLNGGVDNTLNFVSKFYIAQTPLRIAPVNAVSEFVMAYP